MFINRVLLIRNRLVRGLYRGINVRANNLRIGAIVEKGIVRENKKLEKAKVDRKIRLRIDSRGDNRGGSIRER